MSVYVVAQLTFVDEARYRAYQRAFAAAFAGSLGRLLCADEAPMLLEGDWFGDKVVIMQFPSEAAAFEFLQSPRYEAISVDRRAGARAVVLLVKSLDSMPRETAKEQREDTDEPRRS